MFLRDIASRRRRVVAGALVVMLAVGIVLISMGALRTNQAVNNGPSGEQPTSQGAGSLPSGSASSAGTQTQALVGDGSDQGYGSESYGVSSMAVPNTKKPSVNTTLTTLQQVGGITDGHGGNTNPPEGLPAASLSTALYLWDYPAPDVSTVASFLRTKNITEVHVALGWGVVSGGVVNWVSNLRMEVPGVKIVALAGAGCDWVEPGGEVLPAIWVGHKAASGVFDGYNLDIEPWTCGVWNSNKQATIATYLQGLEGAYAARDGKPLYLTITHWLTQEPAGAGSNVAQEVVDRVSGIVVMSYLDTYAAVLVAAQEEVAMARAAGKYSRIAITTDAAGTNGLLSINTFADNTPAELDDTIRHLNTSACLLDCATDTYRGAMVQAYASWNALP